MLEMRPGCEACDKDLPADRDGAWHCSFECTFCTDCALEHYAKKCPNCGGRLAPRPTRRASFWDRHPPSAQRVFNPSLRAPKATTS